MVTTPPLVSLFMCRQTGPAFVLPTGQGWARQNWGHVVRTVFGSTLRKILPFLSVVAVIAVIAPTLAGGAQAATYSGIVVDAKTGKVLYSHRADARAYPASLTKMMTLYMLFEALEAGKVTKKSRITMSAHAASMQPSKLGIKPGGSITVEDAILALVAKSANDVAAAVAEELGGTESQFAQMMTRKAHALGMNDTTFRNASGLPNSSQVTTARDMATLGIAMREHFPQYYDYFSTRVFSFQGKRMGNHNRLLGRVKGVDGIKTGYTRASGFNLVTSVERSGRSIVAVVMGGRSGSSRNAQMEKLITAYLSKASRGEDRMVVARNGGNSFRLASTVALPSEGPMPTYRAKTLDPAELRIVTAHSVAASASFDVAAIERRLRELSGRKLPVPTPSPSETLADPVRTASVVPVRPAVPVQAAAYVAEPPEQAAAQALARSQPGWQIQIGATPSQDSAINLLEKARSRAPGLLASVSNYTETVEKGDDTLYRARFTGFESKSDAWGACGQLKKKKFACLAIQN